MGDIEHMCTADITETTVEFCLFLIPSYEVTAFVLPQASAITFCLAQGQTQQKHLRRKESGADASLSPKEQYASRQVMP